MAKHHRGSDDQGVVAACLDLGRSNRGMDSSPDDAA
jgi:hypothetical protein